MAVLGEATVIVRANTTGVENDMKKGFSRMSGSASAAGREAGQRFSAAFRNSSSDNVFGKFSAGLRSAVAGADAARVKFHNLVREGYTLGTAFSGALGGISAAIGGISALAATAAGAIASVSALGSTIASLGVGLGVAKLALGGVGGAISKALKPATGGGGSGGGSSGGGGSGANAAGYSAAQQKAAQVAARKAQEAYAKAVASANEDVADAEKALADVIAKNRETMIDANNDVRDAQLALNSAIKEGQKEIRDTGFAAEDAALNEKAAALALNKARAALAAVQDLPPNNAARQAAELAYQQADLNYREAKVASQDANAEAARLAKTGVAGTDAVISATKALQQAQVDKAKAVQDALKDQEDAQDALNDAKKEAAATKADKPQTEEDYYNDHVPSAPAAGAAGAAGGGGSDPFAGLNQAQKDFALFILSLKPKFDELKRIAAEGFLPPLQKAIQNLVDNAYPTVAAGVGVIARAMGTAVVTISEAITAGNHMKELATFFQTAAGVIVDFGSAMGSVFGIVLSLLTASAPLTARFTGWVVDIAARFDAWLNGLQDSGQLTEFFNTAGDTMAMFGSVFGNLFGFLGKVIMANFGPGTGGYMLLDWLNQATQGLADVQQSSLNSYFIDVANNARAIGGALGGVLKIFLELGANPAIGEAFTIIQAAEPAFENLAKTSAEAAPQLAELFVKIMNILSAMADTGAIQIFFDTLSTIADGILALFGNETLNSILIITGRVGAFLAALGLVGKLGSFGFKAISGSVAIATDNIGRMIGVGKGIGEITGILRGTAAGAGSLADGFKYLSKSELPLSSAFGKVGGAALSMGGSISKAGKGISGALGGPVGVVLTLIGILVGAFITLYNTSDSFRNTVNNIFGSIMDAVGPIVDQIMGFIQPLIPVITDLFSGLLQAALPIVEQLIGALLPAFQEIGGAFIDLLPAFQPLVDAIMNDLVPAILSLVEQLLPIFVGLVTQLAPVFGQIVSAVVPLVTLLVESLAPVFGEIISAIAPLLTILISALVPIITTVISAFVPLITLIINLLVPVFTLVIQAITPLIELIVAILVPIIKLLAATIEFLTPIIVAVAKVFIDILVGAITFVVSMITDFSGTWETIWAAISLVFKVIWDGIKSFIQGAIGFVRDTITNVVNGIRTIWNAGWEAIKAYFSSIWDAIKLVIKTSIGIVRDTISNVTKTISNIWNTTWGGIKSYFTGVWDAIKLAVAGFKSFFRDAFSGIGGFVKSAFDGVLGAVRTPINGIIALVNKAISGLNGLSVKIPDWVPVVGGQTWGLNLPKIPQLAKGGVIMPSAGGTLVNVAEAGRPERVEPLDDDGLSERDKAIMAARGMGGIQIDVHPSPGMDEELLARLVSEKLAFALRKGAVR